MTTTSQKRGGSSRPTATLRKDLMRDYVRWVRENGWARPLPAGLMGRAIAFARARGESIGWVISDLSAAVDARLAAR